MSRTRENLLRSLSDRTGLRMDLQDETLFGCFRGYETIVSFSQNNQLLLTVCVSSDRGAPDAHAIKQFAKQTRSLGGCSVSRYAVTFFLRGALNRNKLCEQLADALEAITAYLREGSYQNCCQACGAAAQTDACCMSGEPALLCGSCFSSAERSALEQKETEMQREESVLRGTVGALLGSFLGALVVLLLGQLGYVAALSGVVAAVCTFKGYEKLGGRLTKKGVVISLVCMAVMIFLGYQADWALLIARTLEIGFFDSFGLISFLLEEVPELKGEYASGLFQVYAFAAIGAIPAIRARLRSRKQRHTAFRMGEHAEL